jgi:hypothetical protein
MQRGVVLSLCDRTANMVKPWAEAGFECICVDLQHDEIAGHPDLPITYVGGDVCDGLPPKVEYKIVFAFPPCTHLAVSGARWFRRKGLGKLADALSVVEACRCICEWAKAPWMLENPVSSLSTYWREPDVTFNPCDYGGYLDVPADAYTKRTCLWYGGGFRMPCVRPVPPVEGSRMNRIPPCDNRGDLRSETPAGFAQAVFEANVNGGYVEQTALFTFGAVTGW